jgi:hypothetical protein
MKPWLACAFGIAVLTVLQACVAGGGYYNGGGAEVAYGADFYEPYGYEYGGWGPSYWVGPPRNGDHRPDYGHDHPGARPPAYRPAAPSRPMPSIPSRPRRR